jgi:PhnB protein
MAQAKPIPDGYNPVTPYMTIANAPAAIDFYKSVFGARERMRMDGPGGKVGHAELEIGASVIMLSDEYPDMGCRSPKSLGGTPVALHLYVTDVDGVMRKAEAAGARITRPAANQFYGDRLGSFEDPFGHIWHIATHVEDVPPAELEARAAQAMKEMGG